jgi:hypothetical protein
MTRPQVWKVGLGVAILLSAALVIALPGFADGPRRFDVVASNFDPFHTHLVVSEWENGLGCPTGAKEVLFNPNPPFNLLPPSSLTDPACATGDPNDTGNAGLLLAKSGDTPDDAAAGADIKEVKGIVLTELGYDIRHGSHCGAGAPRFNITTTTGKLYFLGCSSPIPGSLNAPGTTTPGTRWDRLRWGTGTAGSVPAFNSNGFALEPIADPVKSISIIFDEAQDTGPDFTGLAILDNIDINGSLEGDGK